MKRLLFLHIILLFSVLAWSQGSTVITTFPYECSFEEGDASLAAWTLNYGTPTATDKWIYGSAVHSEGRRALYPSEDGVNPVYGNNPNITVAYMLYKFPTATTTQLYDVSFDWKGAGDATTSKLYVLVCLESALTATGARNLDGIVNATRLSNQQVNACQSLGESGDKFICGSVAWQNVSFTNPVSVSSANSQKNFAFVFIWVNENSNEELKGTSVSIDNFQINTNMIKKPTDLVVYPHCEDSSLIVTWDGVNASAFDVQYRKVGDLAWSHTFGDLSKDNGDGFSREGTLCTFIVKPVLEGSYDVRVRGKGDGLITSYTYSTNILVYCPENHCINYVDLHSPNVVCTTGMNPDYSSASGQTPYDNIGIVDYGPESKESRHTLHVDPNELDPRTDNMLHTVPQGALASVRLGNWHYMGEAESITYDILVDSTNQGILIVKYAVVLENPGTSHDQNEEPRFDLQILRENGQLVDETCGQAVFSYSDGVNSGWQTTEGDKAVWKDWTTVGVNLMPYHGENIKVRFTTYDCSQGGHYGYAYFTVDCANAHIETESCGSDALVTCVAPEGFNYEWRDENGDLYSTEQVFVPDPGLHTFTCKVSFIEEPDCFFEISTISAPRFPVPEYTYEPVYGNCLNRLKFNNTSHVMNKFEGYENHTSERCNAARWEFTSLTTGQTTVNTGWSPTYTGLETGDSIKVALTAYIGANNSCDSTIYDTIVIPNIIPQDSVINYTTCPESPYKFGNEWYERDTIVQRKVTNIYGCDSTVTLYLTVLEKAEDEYKRDSICSDQSVVIDGIRYNQPMENKLFVLKTENGCNKYVYYTLVVNERLQIQPELDAPYFCADEEQLFIHMDITAGIYDSLVIDFDTEQLHDTVIYANVTSVSIPYPATILPGHFTATLSFYQFCCGVHTETREFDIRYPASIVEQKWNDVLTLLSPKYNGGYTFKSIQWYKDDMPLVGETKSYLYQTLDENATYSVELTREDGVKMKTCPVQPTHHEEQTPYPTVVPAGQHVPMYMEHPATIWYYTASGQLISSYHLPQGYTDLPTPTQIGSYILKSVDKQGKTKAQIIIVE